MQPALFLFEHVLPTCCRAEMERETGRLFMLFIFWVVEPSDSRARFPLRAGITFGRTSERTDLGAIKHKLTKLDAED
jgi:hypothetical protein